MKMGIGIWVMILGILGIIIGGAMYVAKYHRTIGTYGIYAGIILLVIGAIWWFMKDRKGTTPAPSTPQAQPAKTP